MDLLRSRRAGIALLAIGAFLVYASVAMRTSTVQFCTGMESVLYETVGVHPTLARVTDIDLASMRFEWYDGCNWHRHPLGPAAVGIPTILLGVTITLGGEKPSDGSNR